MIGRIAKALPLRYVKVARRNIELCFPELSQVERQRLLARHFESLGASLCESAMTWWSDDERVNGLSHIDGLQHLDAELGKGQGVILLTAHFTTLEMGARILNGVRQINVLYKPPGNALLAKVANDSRASRARSTIERDDIRTMIKALRNNEIVWYAPDQSFRKKGAQMVPFFGIPAATNTFTSRLARLTGASVLYFTHERLPQDRGYRVVIHPPQENFPSDDDVADTLRYHAFIESEVRRIPEQYWWIHRRFKGLSPTDPDWYKAGLV